jgi:hypothetical protein
VKLRRRIYAAILLFPVLLFAQATKPAATAEQPASSTGGSYPVMSAAAKARLRQLFNYLESGQPSPLFTAFSPQMKKGGSLAQVSAMEKELGGRVGREQKMLGENFAPEIMSKNTVYSRYSQFAKSKDPVFTFMAIDEQGQIAALQSRPMPAPPTSRYADYKVQTKLKLPFNGDWFVMQGGRDIYQNVDAFRDAERYSMVFTLLKDGQTYSGDGTKNEQYFCYGQPVAAPADGTVVLVNNTFVDNVPGRPESPMPGGNRVVIAHGNKEYSVLLHLKQNSIKVKNGAKVKQGDVIAECGNSGNSPAPHLEYRLQNSKGAPVFPFTLPAQFVDYVADGKPVAAGEPVRGESVRNGTETATAAAEKK